MPICVKTQKGEWSRVLGTEGEGEITKCLRKELFRKESSSVPRRVPPVSEDQLATAK